MRVAELTRDGGGRVLIAYDPSHDETVIVEDGRVTFRGHGDVVDEQARNRRAAGWRDAAR
ncbi:MAG: hypothetical protein IT545_12280 [Rhodobacteraceae bacterium]|nr:hypothetical protein [Paracoccaceae bacterium]